MTLPRYPVFIPSKGRWQPTAALTARVLDGDGVPFSLVVEPPEADAYRQLVGSERVIVLPFADLGQGSIPARNWIKDYATNQLGAARHWQLDDNIGRFDRFYCGERIPCAAGLALRVVEDFSDRYENIAISGLNYQMFASAKAIQKPFYLNCHVYSCTLINNAIPHRWRGRYNEDTDLCLQVLADGWCTVLINTFLADKKWTMLYRGGNTDQLYAGDGRLRMARALERRWPYVVEVDRRFHRPQHVIRNSWRRFDTPLRLRADVDLSQLPAIDEYGAELREVRPVHDRGLKRLVDRWRQPSGSGE